MVLEVDEAWLGDVTRATKPRVVALLNLSRDQLDRANEVRRIAERWRDVVASEREAIGTWPTPTILSSSTPRSSPTRSSGATCRRRGRRTPCRARGVRSPCTSATTTWWSECGFAKPTAVSSVLRDRFHLDGASYELQLQLPGEFNEADAAMALTALSCVDADVASALTKIGALTSVAGRFSEVLLARPSPSTSAREESGRFHGHARDTVHQRR